MAEQTYSWSVRGFGRPGRGVGGGRGTGGAGRGGARWRNRCVLGGGCVLGGCTPPSAPSEGWLVLGEGGERPGTRRPRRGMEEEAAAAAADVIWSWAEQVMEKGIMTPEVGSPRMGS